MAGSYAEARRLVELADAKGLRLSCSPITFMGDAQEAAWSLIADGAIGNVRVVYAEVNWGRIETWHPRPAPFYAIGPMADVGVYPLTILTAMFGPARRVTAHGQIVYPDRLTISGEPFTVGAPDFGVALIELADGTLVRLTTSFYVGQQSKQNGIEFHGDTGSLFMSSWQDFDAAVELAPFGGTYEPVPVPGAFHGVDWGRALGELADCDRRGAAAPRRRGARRPRRRDPRRRGDVGAGRRHGRGDLVVHRTAGPDRRRALRERRRRRPRTIPRKVTRGHSMSSELHAVPMSNETHPIPWEDRPPGSAATLWRSSLNPIIARDQLPPLEQHLQLRGRPVRERLRRRVPRSTTPRAR